ncbi:MAG: azurin [Advenella sp.]|uniref:azurin n=1 Tax=Advenella sp. TaxID=1872388 RepID=UPI00258F1E1C|nr:azurin [Advenella sp.]MDD3756751.1 azurin [Advenella sp.]
MSFKKLALAAVLSVAATPVLAAECVVDIESNDAMQFNTKEISISKTCEEFTINMKHVGKLPAAAMGHNVVITKTEDMQAVATDGIAAGAAKNYVKEGDERIVAHTKLIGGGESTSVTFPVKDLVADTDYTFFCSFPGHSAIMKGDVKLVD